MPLFDGGIGAVEIGTRLEELRFRSASREGPAFANPRADHLAGNAAPCLDERRELADQSLDQDSGQRAP